MKKILSIMLAFVLALAMISVVYAADTKSDFSNATYKINEQNSYIYDLRISNVKFGDVETGNLKYMFTSSSTQPTYNNSDVESLSFDKSSGEANIHSIEKYLELKQDMYLWIFETDGSDVTGKIVYNKKIEKPELKKYTDVFTITQITKDSAQVLFNAPWSASTKRNIKIKVGEVTDNALLNSIKNKESNCFEKLVTYAKNNTGKLIDETVKSNTSSANTAQGYYDGKFSIKSNVEDGKYYYLYAYVDDENGKYIPIEGVTLAYSSNPTGDYWFLFFLGEDDFKWKDFTANGSNGGSSSVVANTSKDNTIAKTVLPATGADLVVSISIFALAISTVIAYVKIKKYRDVD